MCIFLALAYGIADALTVGYLQKPWYHLTSTEAISDGCEGAYRGHELFHAA
jgi:hypothetical protein